MFCGALLEAALADSRLCGAVGVGKRDFWHCFKLVLAELLEKMAFTFCCRYFGLLLQSVGGVVVAAERSTGRSQLMITQPWVHALNVVVSKPSGLLMDSNLRYKHNGQQETIKKSS